VFFQFSGILLPLSLPHRFPCFPVLPRAGSSAPLIGSGISLPRFFISCRWFRICSRGSLGSGCRPLCSVPDLSPLFVPALCLPLCRSVSLSRDPAACSLFCPSVGAWGLFCTVNIALHPNTSRQILSI
jgi:hypothetical protein